MQKKITRISALPNKQGWLALFLVIFLMSVDSFFDYDPCLFGRAELQFLVCILGEMMTL